MTYLRNKGRLRKDKIKHRKMTFKSIFRHGWSDVDQNKFHEAMISCNKDFNKISTMIGKRVDDCYQFYFNHYKSFSSKLYHFSSIVSLVFGTAYILFCCISVLNLLSFNSYHLCFGGRYFSLSSFRITFNNSLSFFLKSPSIKL